MSATERSADRVYLDWAATAPFDERLKEAMEEASWANANSLYAEGKTAARQLDDARHRLAAALDARTPAEIVFTSGGTEADNTALRGLAHRNCDGNRTAVLIGALEHHAVHEAARILKREGFDIFEIPASSGGLITVDALQATLEKATSAGKDASVVAVQAVNNELGTVQPVADLAQTAHRAGARFFCDAVQGLGKTAIDLEGSGVDAAAFSAHKIGGLKGSGALYLRRSVPCDALIVGGGQEAGRRGGTSNVLGALVFAEAAEHAVAEREETCARLQGFKDEILANLSELDAPHGLTPTLSDQECCVPQILSLLCDGLEGETLVQRFDAAGIAVSSGSACSSGSLDPSHVITGIGISKERAFGSLRISCGRTTTAADIERFLTCLEEVLR
ncbi:MAG: cysteine desulfurase [Coriobacteriaceae bacterium]|nr:cysteine desulfurase [Coriobacteriaceae bacterium]